ncbi:Uncharacterised protein [uncultured archaeon]|nr:Uncharacterised protein [uncultured archaeon]
MNRRHITFACVILLLLIPAASAKRILFYEISSGNDYRIEGGYSKLLEELRTRGHDVASMTKGEITKEALTNYDLLIIPDLNRPLKSAEISSIIWFVLQQGKGLFIIGGEPTSVNMLTIPFGATIDDGRLVDTTNPITGDADRTHFVISRFNELPTMRVLRQGITKVGFYGGYGLRPAADAKIVSTGDTDTYSETGSFASGSQPPISAATIFGKGLVFIHTDAAFLSDQHINDFDNKRYGLNIIEWLAISSETLPQGNSTQELQIIIGEYKLENARLLQQVTQCTEEKTSIFNINAQITSELLDAKTQVEELQHGRIGPFTPTNWAIIGLGVLIFISALMVSRKRAKVQKAEDVLGELGYEMDDKKGKGGGQGIVGGDLSDLGLKEEDLGI